MDEFDVLVFLVVLAIGLLIIPSHYDPLKLFLYSRRIFGELTAGISERDFGRIIHAVRTVSEDYLSWICVEYNALSPNVTICKFA